MQDQSRQIWPLLAACALFWAFAYALYSFMAGFPAQDFDALNVRRMIATGIGALVLLLALRSLITSDHPRKTLLKVLEWTSASAAAVLVARLVYDYETVGLDDTASEHAVWLLIWVGYFAAWVLGAAAFLQARGVRAFSASANTAPAISVPSAATRPMIHPLAQVFSDSVGPRTSIWQFAVVLDGAKIGAGCNISAHTFIEGGAVLGDSVTLKCGVYVWSGVTLEDDVFCGPNATFTNDKYPISRNADFDLLRTVVKRGASIGAGAVVLPGLIIGERATVGAGAVVTHDVAPGTTVVGNPARPLATSR